MIDQQKDGTRPDGRQENKKKEREQRHSARKTKQAFLRPAGGQGRHKRPDGRQRWRGKDDSNDHKRTKQVSMTTKQTRAQDDAADRCRDAAYGGTIDSPGNRATQQRTEIGITHVWVSLQLPRGCTQRMRIRWASFCSQLRQIRICGRRPEGVFIRVGTIRSPHCPHHLNRNIIFRSILQEAQH